MRTRRRRPGRHPLQRAAARPGRLRHRPRLRHAHPAPRRRDGPQGAAATPPIPRWTPPRPSPSALADAGVTVTGHGAAAPGPPPGPHRWPRWRRRRRARWSGRCSRPPTTPSPRSSAGWSPSSAAPRPTSRAPPRPCSPSCGELGVDTTGVTPHRRLRARRRQPGQPPPSSSDTLLTALDPARTEPARPGALAARGAPRRHARRPPARRGAPGGCAPRPARCWRPAASAGRWSPPTGACSSSPCSPTG